jgi:hypothetical protein
MIQLCRVSHVRRRIAALQMSQISFAIRLAKSFEVFSIQLDRSLNPSDPLVKSGHQYRSAD